MVDWTIPAVTSKGEDPPVADLGLTDISWDLRTLGPLTPEKPEPTIGDKLGDELTAIQSQWNESMGQFDKAFPQGSIYASLLRTQASMLRAQVGVQLATAVGSSVQGSMNKLLQMG